MGVVVAIHSATALSRSITSSVMSIKSALDNVTTDITTEMQIRPMRISVDSKQDSVQMSKLGNLRRSQNLPRSKGRHEDVHPRNLASLGEVGLLRGESRKISESGETAQVMRRILTKRVVPMKCAHLPSLHGQ